MNIKIKIEVNSIKIDLDVSVHVVEQKETIDKTLV